MKQNLASLAVSAASGLVGGSVIVAAGFVNLQDATPGTAQTGHINIDGTGRFGSVGVGSAPTNARVQVNETGTLQGVRASTNSGIGVFGTSTSNNGGLFVTKGNSNAVVGDAQSATGVTAGGVFYNRSDNGVGAWGRQIKATGTGIGVRGSTASATGSAAFFQNENTSSSARIAGPDGSLLTSGALPKHQYTVGTAASMVPIAWGTVNSSAAIHNAGSGNWTMTLDGSNVYHLDIAGLDFTNATQFVAVATVLDISQAQVATYEFDLAGADVQFSLFNASDPTNEITSFFNFVVYSNTNPTLGPTGLPVPARWRSVSVEEWATRDPKGYEAWRKANVAEQMRQLRTAPPVNFDVPRP